MVTVRSSTNALMGGCRLLDFILGLQHSGSADFVSMFMARENSVTEIVHPVMMPISTLCQVDVIAPEEILLLLHSGNTYTTNGFVAGGLRFVCSTVYESDFTHCTFVLAAPWWT